MNHTVETFIRQSLKDGLVSCTPEQQRIFTLMYSHRNPNRTIGEVVDSMPVDKLDWALTQVENTVRGGR